VSFGAGNGGRGNGRGTRRRAADDRAVDDQEPDGRAAGDRDPLSVARSLVVDALSRTERTRGQLEQMLARKGIEEEVAEQILDRFTELGLIDDAGYARMFVESRHANRGLGSRALTFELRRRGVDDQLIAEAVGELDDEQQFETACRIARARLARMSGLAEPVQLRRLAGFLARKGYSGELAMRAVRVAFEERSADF
jgi:regulatory protein